MNLLYPNVSSSTPANLFLIQSKQFCGDPISLIYYYDAFFPLIARNGLSTGIQYLNFSLIPFTFFQIGLRRLQTIQSANCYITSARNFYTFSPRLGQPSRLFPFVNFIRSVNSFMVLRISSTPCHTSVNAGHIRIARACVFRSALAGSESEGMFQPSQDQRRRIRAHSAIAIARRTRPRSATSGLSQPPLTP